MKSLTEYLEFEVPGRRGFMNITGTVAALVRKSGVQEGLCLVNAMHITRCIAQLPACSEMTRSIGAFHLHHCKTGRHFPFDLDTHRETTSRIII
jgi:thiamine phosphate synthase YjbQ (UPF0047 family)